MKYFSKRENIRKRVRWIRRLRLLWTLCIEVLRKSIHTLHLSFSWNITKWCNFYTKTDFWFQKSLGKFGQLQTCSGKSKMLNFYRLLLSKKYIPSLYTGDLSNITFNYLCRKLPSYFETISHFLRLNFSVFFGSNITYFLQK